MNALSRYIEYLDSDKEFTYSLRMEYEWNQNNFEELITLVKETMEEFRDKNVIPKKVVYFFLKDVDFIIGTTSKEIFFNHIPKRYTKEEYVKIIKTGHGILLDLKKKFFAGDWN